MTVSECGAWGGKNVRLKGEANTPRLYESEIEFSLFQLASELIKSKARVFPSEIPKFPKLRGFQTARPKST